MKRKSFLLLIVGLISGLTMMGCGSSESSQDTTVEPSEIQSITYEFGDSTLVAETHRSYTITATSNTVHVVIESYDAITVDEIYEITPAQFQFVTNSMKRNLIRNCDLGDTMCEGGTTESISYSNDQSELFYGTIYYCGQQRTGNLCGNVTVVANRIKELVPNFQKLLSVTP